MVLGLLFLCNWSFFREWHHYIYYFLTKKPIGWKQAGGSKIHAFSCCRQEKRKKLMETRPLFLCGNISTAALLHYISKHKRHLSCQSFTKHNRKVTWMDIYTTTVRVEGDHGSWLCSTPARINMSHFLCSHIVTALLTCVCVYLCMCLCCRCIVSLCAAARTLYPSVSVSCWPNNSRVQDLYQLVTPIPINKIKVFVKFSAYYRNAAQHIT